jgi:hypothetical protein
MSFVYEPDGGFECDDYRPDYSGYGPSHSDTDNVGDYNDVDPDRNLDYSANLVSKVDGVKTYAFNNTWAFAAMFDRVKEIENDVVILFKRPSELDPNDNWLLVTYLLKYLHIAEDDPCRSAVIKPGGDRRKFRVEITYKPSSL